MAKRVKKKKPTPIPPKAEETEEGVVVTFPGRILPKQPPPRRRLRHCPSCGHGPVGHEARYATSERFYLFRCPCCMDPETCMPTKWRDPRG